MSVVLQVAEKFWDNIVRKSDEKNIASQTEPKGIKRICDIAYIDDGNKYHLLDVYYPENYNKNMPVIIDVHGGGWMYGDKELNKIYCLNLAKRGFVVFNMSYRLVPEVTVNEEIQDVMSALKYIKEHLNDYPCDNEHIMLTGDSAGGQLASYASVLLTSEKLRTVFDVVNPDMTIDFLVLTSPVSYMNDKSLMKIYTTAMWGKDYKLKPTYPYMNFDQIISFGKLPKTVVVSSSGDTVALAPCKKIVSDLRRNGVDCEFIYFEKFEGVNLPHVFAILQSEGKAGS